MPTRMAPLPFLAARPYLRTEILPARRIAAGRRTRHAGPPRTAPACRLVECDLPCDPGGSQKSRGCINELQLATVAHNGPKKGFAVAQGNCYRAVRIHRVGGRRGCWECHTVDVRHDV